MVFWLIRKTMTNCETFDCAEKMLTETPISSLSYIILAGTKSGEGIVISRKQKGAVHVDRLNVTDNKWYLVQTNNDTWKGCEDRCASATKHLN